MHRDNKIILERYNTLLNEAVPLLLLGLAAPLAAYMAGKTGITPLLNDTFRKSFGFDINEILNIPGVNLIKYLEPTGVTNWPDVDKFTRIYDADPTDANLWKLYEAMFYAVPIIGKYTKALIGLKSGGKWALGMFSKFGVLAVRNSLRAIFVVPAFRRKLLKYLTYKQNLQYNRAISAVLGVSLTRMLGIRFAATGAVTLTDDAKALLNSSETPFSGNTPAQLPTQDAPTPAGAQGTQDNPIRMQFDDIPNSGSVDKDSFKQGNYEINGKFYYITK